jgi:hypothetical protein
MVGALEAFGGILICKAPWRKWTVVSTATQSLEELDAPLDHFCSQRSKEDLNVSIFREALRLAVCLYQKKQMAHPIMKQRVSKMNRLAKGVMKKMAVPLTDKEIEEILSKDSLCLAMLSDRDKDDVQRDYEEQMRTWIGGYQTVGSTEKRWRDQHHVIIEFEKMDWTVVSGQTQKFATFLLNL